MKNSRVLTFFSWGASIFFLVLTLGMIGQKEWLAFIPALLLALFLAPPIRKKIRDRFDGQPTRGASIALVVALFVIWCIPVGISASRQAEEERIAAELEQARLDSIDQVRQDSVDLYQRNRTAFIQQASYVTEGAYDSWANEAHDSSTNPNLRVEAFLSNQKRIADSTELAMRRDSIARARERDRRTREYEREQAQKEAEKRRAEQAAIRQHQSNCTYNGHTLHRGPRGGCYYYSGSGKKVYVQGVSCGGC